MIRRLKTLAKPAYYLLFRKHPNHFIGWARWSLLSPSKRAAWTSRFFTDAGFGQPLFRRCVRHYLVDRYGASGSDPQDTPADNLRYFWGGKAGADWHQAQMKEYAENREYWAEHRRPIYARLMSILERESYDYVVEIGCSNGHTIEDLSRLAKGRARFVGLDINREVIEANLRRYEGSDVEYAPTSVQDFIRTTKPESLLLVSVGVLEWFTQSELEGLLSCLTGEVPKAAIVLHEPFDPLAGPRSEQPWGSIWFHHNYPLLLDSAGFADLQCETSAHYHDSDVHILASGIWEGRRPDSGHPARTPEAERSR